MSGNLAGAQSAWDRCVEKGQGTVQPVEKTLLREVCPHYGGGARGGGSPPRVGSNALNALLGKAFSQRSEDFSGSLTTREDFQKRHIHFSDFMV